MSHPELRYRQVHLDFHTSGAIPGVASAFDPDAFSDTLQKSRVDSITCFARGHHGWMYYDSQQFPERVHPHLENRNLLKEQIKACHARDIRVPIYITVQWDKFSSRLHPEWCVVSPDGRLGGFGPLDPGFGQMLCVNTPFRDFLKQHTREVIETLPCDGLFFDIVLDQDCSCRFCQASMREKGMDPADRAQRLAFSKILLDEFRQDMTACVREVNSDCTIFYNRGHVGAYIHESLDTYTHLELESLPSGGWGYLHFPLSMRYARTLGPDCLGMTGKFHTMWGDFHSFKNRPALEYECFQMLALNAKCSIGDQLHPNGRIDPHVYDLIGSVYEQVEAKEPWCRGAKAVTDIGLLTPEEQTGESVSPPAGGAVSILQEGRQQFDVLDSKSDFALYRVLILPDRVPVDAALATKLEAYVAKGGSIIASYESGLNPEGTDFALDALGVDLVEGYVPAAQRGAGESGLPAVGAEVDFFLPRGPMAVVLPETEHVMYSKAVPVRPRDGAETLADVVASYFDRTWEHSCSHLHAPSTGDVVGPAAVKQGRVIYLAHPVFTLYRKRAPRWCKQIVLNALALVLRDPILLHNGPSTLLATVNEQADEKRWVVHLLHYIPERRGEEFDTIEDVIPVHDVLLSINTPTPPKSVRLVPEGADIAFEEQYERTQFTVPRIEGHAMIEIAF